MPTFLKNRRFVFLVECDDDLPSSECSRALRALRSLVDRLNGSCLLIFDEANLSALRLQFSDAKVLVVRPMEVAVVRQYLLETQEESDMTLAHLIDLHSLGDLAAAPWLLTQMRDLIRLGHRFG